MENEQVLETSEGQVGAVPEPATQETPETLSSVLSNALKEKSQAPSPETAGEVPQKASTPEEKAYAELVLNDQEKLEFKTEKDFKNFIESNKVLKENFLRQQDYTRKTQELANERKAIEEAKKQHDGLWGEVKPNEGSLMGIQSLWKAYQTGDPNFQTALNRLVEDAFLITQGQQPKNLSGNQNSMAPEVVKLQEQVSQLTNYFEQQNLERATNEWESFKSAKEKAGIQFTDDVIQTMAHFLAFTDPKTGKPMSLEKAYDYTVRELGMENLDATKKVFANAGVVRKKTPSAPNSNIPSTLKPEPKTFSELLRQGASDLT